ncbi:MAG: hypothetical protein OXR66_02985 [Candidatus Woesearchaeota archaeon]|nr:hypothetical protein [Candidatus Woesearchaeota archaeon]
MSDINRDLDRYLRSRKTSYVPSGAKSWWEKVFTKAKQEEMEDLSEEEAEKLEEIEEEIQHGEEELEAAHEYEQELEVEQERRVSLYHQVLNFFKRQHHEPEEESFDEVAIEEDEVHADMKRLAEIQMKWFERLPLRAKMDFKDSDDREELLEILERRGVARKK